MNEEFHEHEGFFDQLIQEYPDLTMQQRDTLLREQQFQYVSETLKKIQSIRENNDEESMHQAQILMEALLSDLRDTKGR